MEKPSFVYSTYIRTTPERLWQALTEPAFTERHWGVAFETDWKPGSPLTLRQWGLTISDLRSHPAHRRTAAPCADRRVRTSKRVRTRTIVRGAEHSRDAVRAEQSCVAIAMVRRKAAGRQERSRDAGSRTLEIRRRRSPWSAAPALAFTRLRK